MNPILSLKEAEKWNLQTLLKICIEYLKKKKIMSLYCIDRKLVHQPTN